MSGAFVFWLTGKTGQPKVPIPVATGIGTFGWPVFPVNQKTKAPLIAEWQSRASSNSCEIEHLFRNYPDAAIGLVTGQRSGLVVIDIDERENFS